MRRQNRQHQQAAKNRPEQWLATVEAKMKKSSQYEEARKMEQAMTSDRGFISW